MQERSRQRPNESAATQIVALPGGRAGVTVPGPMPVRPPHARVVVRAVVQLAPDPEPPTAPDHGPMPRRAASVPAGPWRRWAPHALILGLVVVAVAFGKTAQEQTLPAVPLDRISTYSGTDFTVQPEPGPGLPGRRVSATALGAAPPANDYLTLPALPITVAPQRVGLHEVKPGETLASIAQQHGLDVPTLQWANGVADATAPLLAGQQLRVPPVKGMLHVTRQSDTLESVAATYRASPQAILDYKPNGVRDAADIVPGRTLIVPGGVMPERTTVTMHTVREGETVFAVAERYNVTPETIISANSLEDADFLYVGQRLAILPVSGVGLIVQQGDSVGELAARYRVDESAIRGYGPNGLGAGGEVVPGQALVVPGGRLPDPPAPAPAPEPEPAVQAAAAPAPQPAPARAAQAAPPAIEKPAPRPTPVPVAPRPAPTGRMVWPTTGSITTYFTGAHNGLDIANGTGTPIVAADGGVVTWSGWRNDGLGIAVFIDHGGGLQTWYGHFSRAVVSPGQVVGRGQVIGYMGSTGRSTGPHLHFMVLQNYGYRNPLNYLP